MTYLRNLSQWFLGLFRLGRISYKENWNAWKFAPLYLVNYGTHVLCGGACVSWSRYFHDNRDRQPQRFMDRTLGWLDPNHGAETGPALWGTKDTGWPWYVRLFAAVMWAFVPSSIGAWYRIISGVIGN